MPSRQVSFEGIGSPVLLVSSGSPVVNSNTTVGSSSPVVRSIGPSEKVSSELQASPTMTPKPPRLSARRPAVGSKLGNARAICRTIPATARATNVSPRPTPGSAADASGAPNSAAGEAPRASGGSFVSFVGPGINGDGDERARRRSTGGRGRGLDTAGNVGASPCAHERELVFSRNQGPYSGPSRGPFPALPRVYGRFGR